MSFFGAEVVAVKEEPVEVKMEDNLEAPPLKNMKKEEEEPNKKRSRSKLTSEEKKAERRRKNAERMRAKRERLKSELTPEEFEEWREKKNERRRVSEMTPEVVEVMRRKKADQRKRRIARMTPEELEAYNRKNAENSRESRKRHGEEIRRRSRFQNFVKKATMTEEELEAKKLKTFLYNHANYQKKGRWRDRPEEEKRKSREQLREWTRNLTGEKRRRFMEAGYRRTKKMLERYKTEAPEKLERWKEKQRERLRKAYANETPEKRARRRHKEKVNGARRRLKKKLEGEGVGKEEIERRDEELRVRMWKEFDPEGEVPSTQRGRKVVQRGAGSVKTEQFEISISSHVTKEAPPSPPACTKEDAFPLEEYSYELDNGYLEMEDTSPPSSPLRATSFTLPSPSPPEVTPRPNELHSCSHCPSTFPTDTDLRVHIRSNHPEKCWKCPKCGDVVMSPQELSQHYQSSHKIMEETPPPSLSELHFYCMRCAPPPSLTSGQVQLKGFKTGPELLSHVKANHPDNYWPCDRCHLLKYSNQALQLHRRVCRHHQDSITTS